MLVVNQWAVAESVMSDNDGYNDIVTANGSSNDVSTDCVGMVLEFDSEVRYAVLALTCIHWVVISDVG